MEMNANAGRRRFRDGAREYAAYLETPDGRLRSGLVFANVAEFLPLPQPRRPLRALDIGCGTGAIAVRLAWLGVHAMLDLADRAAREAGVAAQIVLKHGDVVQVANLFCTESFDVIGSVRLFTPDSLPAMLKAASLAVAARRGVRVVSDYLPPAVSRTAEYERILALERKLGSRPEFAAVARYTHHRARRAVRVVEDRG